MKAIKYIQPSRAKATTCCGLRTRQLYATGTTKLVKINRKICMKCGKIRGMV